MRGHRHGHRCRHGLASHAAIAAVARVAFAIAPAIAAVVAARIASPTSPALGLAILAMRVAKAAARCSVRAHLSAGGYGGAEQCQHQCSTGSLGRRFDFHGNAFMPSHRRATRLAGLCASERACRLTCSRYVRGGGAASRGAQAGVRDPRHAAAQRLLVCRVALLRSADSG